MKQWSFKKYGYEKYAILNDEGHEQATTHSYDNALMISAAPEMFEVLSKFMEFKNSVYTPKNIFKQAEDVLKKASVKW